MNRNYLKYILIGGVSILGMDGCDDYLNRESTSGVNTPDLIWQNPKAITAVLADMYDSGLKLDEPTTGMEARRRTWRIRPASRMRLPPVIRRRAHSTSRALLILMATMYLTTTW